MRFGGLSSSQLARLASSCCAFDVVLMVLDGGVDVSKKNFINHTIQQVSECLTNMLVNERLQTCTQDEYASYRSTQWIYRTKIAREIAQKNQNSQNK
jgi:predicted Co/Zn/Cd cation transporter (cation efflux family)